MIDRANIPYAIIDRLVALRDRAEDTQDNERRTESMLRVTLTDTEIIAYSKEAADANAAVKSLEADLNHLKKSMQAKIDAQKALGDIRSECIRNGYELRDVPCADVLEFPHRGKKTTFRLDTLEPVSEGMMTDSEKQRMMRFDEAQAAKAEKVKKDAETPPAEGCPIAGSDAPKSAGKKGKLPPVEEPQTPAAPEATEG